MEMSTACVRCGKFSCYGDHPEDSPKNCPMRLREVAVKHGIDQYQDDHIREFARAASVQEFEGYLHLPEGRTPRNPRVEEVAQFAKKMGYKKLGIAFCYGLRHEARKMSEILENRGFEVVSVCCKVGAVPKETVGVDPEQKIRGAEEREAMCNPITQAEVLNVEGVDLNVAIGLCVGHDSLFFQFAKAPTTVLIAKDRVFGHNPAAGLYLSDSYYAKLMREE